MLVDQDATDFALTLDMFSSVDRAFAAKGTVMRQHAGRSVVRVAVAGRPHFLKRYWLQASQVLQRHVARGMHELRMIRWLEGHGFGAPRVAATGASRRWGVTTRLFFLMEQVPGERALERSWFELPNEDATLLDALAKYAAALHDAGFVHTDFSERHILVGRDGGGWTFRLVDLERACSGNRSERRAAADLKTLSASIADRKLRRWIERDFVDVYLRHRRRLSAKCDFRRLLAHAKPTRRFS